MTPLPPGLTETRVLLATTCHSPSVAMLTLAFARNGATVLLVAPGDHPARKVRRLAERFSYSALAPMRSLEVAIGDGHPAIVIPCDERAVRDLHRLHAVTSRADVRALIERSLGAPAAYPLSEARHALLSLAGQAGVLVPATATLEGLADLRTWQASHPLPWVIKADGSWAGFGVRVVSSLAEAERAFQEMTRPVRASFVLREAVLEQDLFWVRDWLARRRPAISVQSYIEGPAGNCAVACWRGEVLAAVPAEVVTAERKTGPSTVMRLIHSPAMVESARKVVRALGSSGFVGFDFVIEAATGQPYLVEMNPRSTPTCHIRLGEGRDLVEALQARVAGRPERAETGCTHKDTVAFFPHAWRHDPASRYLQTSYHDVPWEEPDLVRELMLPERRDRHAVFRLLRRALRSLPPADGERPGSAGVGGREDVMGKPEQRRVDAARPLAKVDDAPKRDEKSRPVKVSGG